MLSLHGCGVRWKVNRGNTAKKRLRNVLYIVSGVVVVVDGRRRKLDFRLAGVSEHTFPKETSFIFAIMLLPKLRKHRRRSLASWKSRNAVPTAPAIPNLRALCFFAIRIIITRIPLTAAAKKSYICSAAVSFNIDRSLRRISVGKGG